MSDFRKLGPAVVDADRVRIVMPSTALNSTGIEVFYADGTFDFVAISLSKNAEITIDDLIRGAINEFYRPYNPPGAVFYEPAPIGVSGYSGFSGVTDFTWETKPEEPK